MAKVTPDHPFFELIEVAYRVFSYPRPKSVEVCEHCCMDAQIEGDFFNPRIRQLPLRYIRDWYFAAYQPPGVAKETWAYLLPRILEILAAGEDASDIGLEVSLSRFQTGNPDNWSVDEWRVLDRFQRAFLARKLEPDNEFLDDVICMFALAGWPVETLVEQVAAATDEQLAERFWNDWCRCIPGREGIWITAFWEDPGRSTVYDFYTSPELLARMTKLTLGDHTEVRLAEKALAVASVIEAASQ